MNASHTTASHAASSARPRTVRSPGSPGPAPTKETVPGLGPRHSALDVTRTEQRRQDGEHGGEARTRRAVVDGAAEQLVAEDQEPDEERRREARVPRPPRTPDRLPPERPGQQHHGREGETHLSGALSHPVELL